MKSQAQLMPRQSNRSHRLLEAITCQAVFSNVAVSVADVSTIRATKHKIWFWDHLAQGFQKPVQHSHEIGEALCIYLLWRHLHPLEVEEDSSQYNKPCMLKSEVMKYSEIDMQEIPRQMSPLTQVQNNIHSIQDRSNWRSRHSDLTNSNGSKDSPEIIDLDGDESPIKEKLEKTITVNGVTATVKKVSLPWQDKTSSDDTKKTITAPKEEIEIPGKVASENVVSKEVLPTSSGAEESVSSKVTEGERKRPGTQEGDDGSSKRLKTTEVTDESSTKNVPLANQVNGLVGQDSNDSVSVVDLVDEEEEILGKSDEKKLKESSGIVEPKKVQTPADIRTVSPKIVSSPCVTKESVPPPSSSLPVTTASIVGNVQSPSTTPSEDKISKKLSSVISSGANGMLTQMQPIEVKKVKLCPSLEKQATAMSSGASVTISSSAETPKSLPTAASVQNQVPTSTTSQDSPITQKPTTSESVKDTVMESEAPVSGAELEKKLGLNPAHSVTRKLVKKLTRTELEAFLLEMTCDLVFSKSDAGRYRRMYEEMKEISENKSLKIAQLLKQVSDLKSVVSKVVEDQKEKRDIMPHRITRSVGLQLDQNSILNAYKFRSRGEKIQLMAPSVNSSSSNSSSPPSGERPQPQRAFRSAPSSTSKVVLPSTPNGAVTSPISKDATPSSTLVNRSPQKQLRAIHPKLPQTTQSGPLPLSAASPSKQLTARNEPSNKLPGFIDISDESKVLSSGIPVGIRRQKSSSDMLVPNSTGAPGSTNVNINAKTNNQVVPQAMKVVQQHYGQPGNVYPQTSAAPRMLTPVSMPPTTPVTGSRLTYIIPTTSTVPVQQRQLVLTTPASCPQMPGRSPVNPGNPVQTMLMRPNTLVQVSGAISSPSTTIIRTIPNNPIQGLPTGRPQQQHASRVMAMQSRPPAAPARISSLQHPAPLPNQPQPTVVNPNLKPIPRRPVLKLSKVPNGIVLSWNMTNNTPHEEIASYQLYAYQEGANSPPSPLLWKKVGDVKALPLPMACTLTQFADGHTYHFAVRALDVHGRVGEFSVPGTIDLFN